MFFVSDMEPDPSVYGVPEPGEFYDDTDGVVGDDVLIGVTSFGLNGNCAGVGGVFRIDRSVELDWIGSFLD